MAHSKLSAPSVDSVSDGKDYAKEPNVSHYFRELMIRSRDAFANDRLGDRSRKPNTHRVDRLCLILQTPESNLKLVDIVRDFRWILTYFQNLEWAGRAFRSPFDI